MHGHTSLPSSIYEVELRRQEGTSSAFLLQNIYKFPEKDISVPDKKASFKRYLQIKPSLLQTQVPGLIEDDYNYSNWEKNYGYNLGVSENPIWGKTLLYKIKSKATGKMVEVRVKFKRKHGIVDNKGDVKYKLE